jgi:hypothetical protein
MEPGTNDRAAGVGERAAAPSGAAPGWASGAVPGASFPGVYPLSLWKVRRFVPALRRISGELNLPEPTRSRILLEMASDLEALYEHYRARGLDDEEAFRRTEERVLASPEALQHLVAVHTTGYQRWLSHAAGRLRLSFEAILFIIGVVPMLALAMLAITAPAQGIEPSLLLWLLLGLGTAIGAITLWKVYQLLFRRVRSTAVLHQGLFTLLFLGVVSPVLAGIAFLAGLYQAALAFGRTEPSEVVMLAAAERVVHDATLLSAGLLIGIGAGMVWFVLVNRIAVIEQAESAALLAVEA